jgi:putative Ca2+/H+ antiporter (TMEM165/GDT1 family)
MWVETRDRRQRGSMAFAIAWHFNRPTVSEWPPSPSKYLLAGVSRMDWLAIVPTAGAAFLASLVECMEAATIVLAVGTVRGWRSAFTGTVLGLVAVLVIVLALGPALSHLPEHLLQLMVGLLLLLFGMR